MVDWVVLLTPVLVLAVVALLGFAGCGFEGKVGAAPFTLRARVPTTLTVTEVVFRWTPPGGTQTQQVLTTPSSTDGTDNLFDHDFWGDPAVGTWLTNCRVTVQPGPPTGQDGDQGDFLYDGSQDYVRATYQASGSPSGGDFDVSFEGALEEVSA